MFSSSGSVALHMRGAPAFVASDSLNRLPQIFTAVGVEVPLQFLLISPLRKCPFEVRVGSPLLAPDTGVKCGIHAGPTLWGPVGAPMGWPTPSQSKLTQINPKLAKWAYCEPTAI